MSNSDCIKKLIHSIQEKGNIIFLKRIGKPTLKIHPKIYETLISRCKYEPLPILELLAIFKPHAFLNPSYCIKEIVRVNLSEWLETLFKSSPEKQADVLKIKIKKIHLTKTLSDIAKLSPEEKKEFFLKPLLRKQESKKKPFNRIIRAVIQKIKKSGKFYDIIAKSDDVKEPLFFTGVANEIVKVMPRKGGIVILDKIHKLKKGPWRAEQARILKST